MIWETVYFPDPLVALLNDLLRWTIGLVPVRSWWNLINGLVWILLLEWARILRISSTADTARLLLIFLRHCNLPRSFYFLIELLRWCSPVTWLNYLVNQTIWKPSKIVRAINFTPILGLLGNCIEVSAISWGFMLSCWRVIVHIDDVRSLVRIKLNNVLPRLGDLFNNFPRLFLERLALTSIMPSVSLFIVLANFFDKHLLRVSINLFHLL